MKAFVTGGSGFVGGALVRSLVADGIDVRALARSDRSAAAVEALGAEPVRGDLDDAEAIARGAAGCEHAYHAAAIAAEWGDFAEFERANVDGTRNALGGCEQAGVRRFVHVGTEAALYDGKPLVDVDETTPLAPDSAVAYSATKARADQLVRNRSRDGFETVVVRPRLVWGTGDTSVLPGIVAAIENGRFAWVGSGEHRTSTTHIDNAVHGLRLGAEKGRPGRAYFVTDGEPVVFRGFLTELLATQGVEPPSRSIPPFVARGMAGVSEALWRALPLPGDPPMTRLAYFLLATETTIEISRARSELGYEPVKTIEQGMAELRAEHAAGGG